MNRTAHRAATGIVFLLLLNTCTGKSPSTPTPPPAAGLSVSSMTATAEATGTGATHRVSFQLRETSGKVGLTVSSSVFTLRLSDGRSGTGSVDNLTIAVGAGQTVSSPSFALTNSEPVFANTIDCLVRFTDANGNSGSATGSASVTQLTPPPSSSPSPNPNPTPNPTPSPTPSPTPTPGPNGPTCSASTVPSGTTAVCNDGTFSTSQNRSGTCSSHGGVQCWICPGVLCER
jgi:Protein of unknown function (DUF3761)